MRIKSMPSYCLSRLSLFSLDSVLLGVSLGGACFLGINILLSISTGKELNHVSGVWSALALDLRNGIFYRPLYSEATGYGGTRYFPLYFLLHSLIIRLTDKPIFSGHLLSIAAGLTLLVASYQFMRQMNLKPLIACALTLFLLSSETVQVCIQSIRGDILPLALNICGLVVFLSHLNAKYREMLAAVCFVLAFSAKITAVHGIAALFIWLIINGRLREGLRVLLYTIIGYLIFLGMLYFGSSGRVFSIFQTCLFGGASLYEIIQAPLKFVQILVHNSIDSILFFSATLIIFVKFRNIAISLPAIFWYVSLFVSLVIFGSPGTDGNQLVDIIAASLILIAASLILAGYSLLNSKSLHLRSSIYVFIILILFSVLSNLTSFKQNIKDYQNSYSFYPKEVVSLIAQNKGKILSENPLLPIVANKSPYLLDPFALRLILLSKESIKESVINSIEKKDFSLIVFIFNPQEKVSFEGKVWYSDIHFGDEFMKSVFNNYKQTHKFGNFYVYSPS